MRVCVLSANLGSYDPQVEWPAQVGLPAGVTVDVHRFTDANFPPRPLAMTSRLQCGLLKWFGPEFVPGYDVYIWIDASCAPTPTGVAWFLAQLETSDVAFLRHPERKTVREEYEFIKARMARPGETYLTGRYRGEWLDEQFAAINERAKDHWPLFASTAFIYRDRPAVREMFKEVWFGKTRYHLHDQLWLTHAAAQHVARVPWRVIDANYLDCPGLTFTRKKRRAA